MSRPVLLIGISGTTNSGKTTLAEHLQRKIPGCHIIHQDHYFLIPGDERLEYVPEVNHNNWEAYSSLDMDRMTDDVQGKKKLLAESPGSGPGILLVEGFNFFGYHGLNSALNPPLRKSIGMPSTPSCYLGLQVKALVDFGEEEEMPSFRLLPQSAKIKKINDWLSGCILDPGNYKAFILESHNPAAFSSCWYHT